MRDIVKEYQKKFRRNHQRARRYTALLLALALTTSLFVNWQLHGVGIAKTAEYLCGELEHEHTAACYEKQLVCGYEEGEPEDWNATMTDDGMSFDDTFDMDDDASGVDADDPGIAAHSAEPEYIFVPHEHTDDCYQEVQELTCLEEEHTHDDSCFDEDGVTFICDKFEHTHDDSCYTTTYELVCGLEEGELVEEVNPDYDPVALFEEPVAAKPVVVDPVIETPVHHHTDACYEEVLVCGLPEHHHTVNCLSDPLDGTQDEDEWLAQTGTTLSGNWADDLLAVAESQLGYEQSERNFQLDDADGETVRHYTRYGNDYGNDYGPWDVMFLSYCLKYADIPQSAIPQVSSVLSLHSQLRSALYNEETGSGYAMDFDGDLPSDAAMPGDIVIYNGTVTKAVAVESQPLQVQDDSADADIALLSMDAAATTDTAPHIEEYTVDASTVGIVSDVDEDSGTLTVISGDVDGKVAEVTLNASQVTTLVSVANAQQADYGVATPDFKVEDGDGTVTGLDGRTYVDEVHLQVKKGTDYVDSNEFNLTDTVHGKLTFKSIPVDDIRSSNNCVYVALPEEFKAPENWTGKLYDADDSSESGTYSFVKDSSGNYMLVLNYNNDYLTKHAGYNSTVDSKVEFDFNWNENNVTKDGENTIDLGNHKIIVTIKDSTTPTPSKKQFELSKNASKLTYEDKDAYITYTVKLTVNEDTEGPLVLEDVLANPNNASFQYDGVPTITGSATAPSIEWKDGSTGNSKTFTIGQKDTMIAKGTYTITYKVKCANFGSQTFTDSDAVKNTVSLKDHDDTSSKSTSTKLKTNLISKDGSASSNSKIKWTVNINDGDSRLNLKDETFTDQIPDGLTLDQSTLTIKRTGPDGNDVTVVSKGKIKDGSLGETLTVDETGKITCKLADGFYQYKITYTTTVDHPENLPLDGTTYTNTGTTDGDSGFDEAKKDVTVKPSRLKKEAVGAPAIDSTTNKAVLSWVSIIDLADLNGYKFFDFSDNIYRPSAPGNTTQHNYKAQTIIMNSIVVRDGDNTDITEQLRAANAIQAYERGTADADGVDYGLFQIDFGQLNIKGPVTIQYDTEVDMSTFPANDKRDIINYCFIQDRDGKNSDNEDAKQTISTKDNTEHYLKKWVNDSYSGGSEEDLKIGEKISWAVQLNSDGNMPNNLTGPIVITDTLPYGMLLDESSIEIDFNYLNHDGVSPAKNEDYFIQIGTNGEGRTTITVTLNERAYQLDSGATLKPITLKYKTMLDPSKLDELFDMNENKPTHTFKNDASLTFKGGSDSVSAETTITLKVLGKEGSYNDVTGQLSYTVKVNPTGIDLSGGDGTNGADTLLLYDKLSTYKLNERVTLQSISMFAAELQDGDLVATAPLGDLVLVDKNCSKSNAKNLLLNEYGIRVDDSKDILVWARIPNKQPLIFIFNYQVNIDNLVSGDYPLANNVNINGKWEYTEKTTNGNHTSSGSTNINLTNDRLDIIKYSGTINNRVAGAKFTLDYYDNGTWTPFNVDGVSDFVTDSNGKCSINGLERGVVYRIHEKEAPPEYVQPAENDYHYFCIRRLNVDWVLPTVNGVDANQIDVRTPVSDSKQIFSYYCNNTPKPHYVKPGSLKVTKVWQDSNGDEITDKSILTVLKPVNVKLVQHKKNATVTIKGTHHQSSKTFSVPYGSSLTIEAPNTSYSFTFTRSDNGQYESKSEPDTTTGSYHYYYTFPAINDDIEITYTDWFDAEAYQLVNVDDTAATDKVVNTAIDPVAQLSYDNNWTYTWSDLPTSEDGSIWYTLEEVSATDGYTTSYVIGSGEASESCPQITLTPSEGVNAQVVNRSTQSGGYVLPSTGGAGTKLYTAGGGALMLAALVCGVCRKRRRERRAR